MPPRRLLLCGDRRRPGVVRRSQAGGLASSIVVVFVFAFLRQSCLTLCMYLDIVASAGSFVFEFLYSSP